MQDAQRICSFLSDLEESDFDYSVFSDLFEENIGNTNNIYLVAVDEGQVIGFISCHGQILLHHLGKVFEIQELYVEETYRNNGVGRLLIEALEKSLMLENYKSLEVTSNGRRMDAHRFYLNNGFEQSHLKFIKAK